MELRHLRYFLPVGEALSLYRGRNVARTCGVPSVSSGLAADPDTEPDSPVAFDSGPKALCRIQTGQNSLSAVAKNLVPQTGQVRASRCIGPSDSAFTASVVLERRLAHGSLRES